MTGTIKALLNLNRFEHRETVGGEEIVFVLRRFSHSFATQLFGTKAYGLVNPNVTDAERVKVAEEMSEGDKRDALVKTLEIGMIEPRLGETSDPEAGTIAFTDLGDLAFSLYGAIMRSGGSAENFTNTSNGTETAG